MMHFKSALLATSALAVCATMANAGGIDRSRLPYAAMFEEGTYAELGFSTVNPGVTGAYVGPIAFFGASTGNMAESYTTLSLSFKTDLNDKLSVGVFVNQPYGADAKYTAGFYNGLEAHWSSNQIAALVKYDVAQGFSVYGGAKNVTSKAEIAIPDRMIRASMATAGGTAAALAAGAPAGTLAYNATTESDSQTALIVGAAYEKPEIALRVALTYEQGFTHSFASRETLPAFAATPLGGLRNGTTNIEMPRSIALDFQSGVAKDTLVFGMIKYTNWSVWEVRPPLYNAAFNDDVTGIDNDVMTYQLGVGRRLNDNLSVFGRVTYEESKGGVASRLSPTDGSTSFGVGATYRKDNIKITGGIEYAKLGDATDASGTKFSGNDALGLGVQIGYSF
ncbi:MAG: hypothetical protein CFE34_05825 [Rhodobacteraceae bacterium PARR1]|nr:MAG: hypothetical protein CFE34_05825 [Rhodobacteraceae bacterium PARR1]